MSNRQILKQTPRNKIERVKRLEFSTWREEGP